MIKEGKGKAVFVKESPLIQGLPHKYMQWYVLENKKIGKIYKPIRLNESIIQELDK